MSDDPLAPYCPECGAMECDWNGQRVDPRGSRAEVQRLRTALQGMLTAATAPATCDDDWEAEIQAAERALGGQT